MKFHRLVNKDRSAPILLLLLVLGIPSAAFAQDCVQGYFPQPDCMARLQNVGTGRCLDANMGQNGPVVSGTPVTTQDCLVDLVPHQKWRATYWHPPILATNVNGLAVGTLIGVGMVNQLRTLLSTYAPTDTTPYAQQVPYPPALPDTCMAWRSDVGGFIGPLQDARDHTFEVFMRPCTSAVNLFSTGTDKMWITRDLFQRYEFNWGTGHIDWPNGIYLGLPGEFPIKTNVCGPPPGTVPLNLIPRLSGLPAALLAFACQDRTRPVTNLPINPVTSTPPPPNVDPGLVTVVCLTAPLGPVSTAPVTLEACEPGNKNQLWRPWYFRVAS